MHAGIVHPKGSNSGALRNAKQRQAAAKDVCYPEMNKRRATLQLTKGNAQSITAAASKPSQTPPVCY